FVANGSIDVWQVTLIMFREFAVTSIRLVAAGNGKVIAANMLGKIKTVSQIIAIISILVLSYTEYIMATYFTSFMLSNLYISTLFFVIGEVLMAVATFFSLYSGYVYIKENWDSVKQMK
ncbi:MAG: CDP-alcohol phosphatidyltransferase family protein, partial [Clostridia bacterium]